MREQVFAGLRVYMRAPCDLTVPQALPSRLFPNRVLLHEFVLEITCLE